MSSPGVRSGTGATFPAFTASTVTLSEVRWGPTVLFSYVSVDTLKLFSSGSYLGYLMCAASVTSFAND